MNSWYAKHLQEVANELKKRELQKKEQEKLEKTKRILNIIQLILQLVGIIIIIKALGWLVGLGLFLWTTGNNMQVSSNVKNNKNE